MGINLVVAVTDGDWFEMLRRAAEPDRGKFRRVRGKFPSPSACERAVISNGRQRFPPLRLGARGCGVTRLRCRRLLLGRVG